MNRGTLVVFEGIDGTGKSTQLALLAARLEAAGRTVVRTGEPYDDCDAGRRLRAMLRSGEDVPAETEMAWFREQRRAHVRAVIAPALDAGAAVLCDRYFVSTAAYQGARGFDPSAILAESEAEFPIPDLVVLLQIPVSETRARIRERRGPAQPVFEAQALQKRVDALFRNLDREYIVAVDARGSESEVAERVAAAVTSRLGGLLEAPAPG